MTQTSSTPATTSINRFFYTVASTANNPTGSRIANTNASQTPAREEASLEVVATPRQTVSSAGSAGLQRAVANQALSAIQAAGSNLERRLAQCSGGATQCASSALQQFANQIDAQISALPPALQGISAVIRVAATRVASARSISEARAAIGEAINEVQKAIALLRADDERVARSQQSQGATIVSALLKTDNRIARADGL